MALRTWLAGAALVLAVGAASKSCDASAMPASATGTLTILNGCAFIGALDGDPVAIDPGSSYTVEGGGIYYMSGQDPVAGTGDTVRVEGQSTTGTGCLGDILPGGGSAITAQKIELLGHGA